MREKVDVHNVFQRFYAEQIKSKGRLGIWKFSDAKIEETALEVHCNRCGAKTNHAVLRSVKYSDTEIIDERCGYSWGGESQILNCCGCGEFTFRDISWCTEDEEIAEKFFPERLKINPSQLYLREDVSQLPDTIQAIYQEVLSAVQNNFTILAGFGIRAILESVCNDRNAKGGNLFEKIDFLHQAGLITQDGTKILHSIRLLGNDAAHEMKGLTQSQTLVALRVIDHLLLGVYVLPREAKKAKFPEHLSKTV